MSDFDLSKITGNEPPLMTDDDKDAEIERLTRELAEARDLLSLVYASPDLNAKIDAFLAATAPPAPERTASAPDSTR